MERRDKNRLACYFKILIGDNLHLGYVRDISALGIRIETPYPIDLTLNTTVAVKILPPETIGLPPLVCTLNIRWMKKERNFHSIGGRIEGINAPKKQQQYNDYISFYEKNGTE